MPSDNIISDPQLFDSITPDEVALSHALNNIGVFLSINGKLNDALYYIKKSVDVRSRSSCTEMNFYSESKRLEIAIYLEEMMKEESRLENGLRNHEAKCMTLEMFDNYLSYGSTHCYTQHLTMKETKRFANVKSDIAAIHYNLGLVYHKKSFMDEAKSAFITALTFTSKNDSLDLAALIHDNIGEIEYNNGDTEEAYHHFSAALNLKEQSRLSTDHRSIANTLVNIGRIHYYNEEFDQATEVSFKAYSIITKANYDNILDIAITSYNIALISSKRGQYHEAINIYKWALMKIESQLGRRCVQVATILRRIGMTFLDIEEMNEANFYLSQSVEVGRMTIRGGYVVAESLLTLAYHLQNESKYDMALKCYNESLDFKRAILGRTHEEIVEILCQIGIIYDSKRDFSSSKVVYEEIIRITKTVPLSMDQGSFLVTILVVLGKINLKECNIQEAMENFSESLFIVDSLGHTNVETYALDLLQSVFQYAFCTTAVSA